MTFFLERRLVRNSTLPVWMCVSTSSKPAVVKASLSSAMGYLRLPTLTARRNAMKVATVLLGVGEHGGVVTVRPAACPGPGVRRILDVETGLAQLEWPEGVDHDGELVEVLDPDGGLDRARLRSVGVTAWVDGDGPDVDARALARLVVAPHVEHDLVGVDVGVVVGHRDRLLVVV